MIDFLSEKQKSDEVLRNLVYGRSPQDEISKTRSNIESSRGDFFQKTGSLIDQNSPVVNSLASRAGRDVVRPTESKLRLNKLSIENEREQTIFNTLYDQAVNSGLDTQKAMEYAKQTLQQLKDQENMAAVNERERQAKLERNTMANDYADRGVALDQQYQPKPDYTNAMLGVLLGTGSSIYANKMNQDAYQKRLTARETRVNDRYSAQRLRYDQMTPAYDNGYNAFPTPQRVYRPIRQDQSFTRENIYG